jgi:hypothetical protein
MANQGNSERRPEGKEGAGAHQEGRNSKQSGQTNRRAGGDNQKHERAVRQHGDQQSANASQPARAGGGDTGRRSDNDHQKTVQGKNQKGPDAKAGRDVGGGNEGSKGQNVDQRRARDEHTGKQDDRRADDNEQKGGDRSDRAAVSGATGERSSSGGQNKPQPRDQDEKGMGHPRNR